MARKLSRQLGIRLDYDEVEKLFFRRLDDPSLIISRGFEANFDDPTTEQQRRIKGAIDEHRARSAAKMEKDLFVQKTRLVNAQRSLKEKETKKAREDVRIAGTKIETLATKLSSLRNSAPNEEDNRIFPFVYTGVIVKKDGQNLLTPMRYFCRQAGKPAFYDRKFPGLYNARRDNLEKFRGAIWVASRHHGRGKFLRKRQAAHDGTSRPSRRRKGRECRPTVQAGTRADHVCRLSCGRTGRIQRNPKFAVLPLLPMSRRPTSQLQAMIVASSI